MMVLVILMVIGRVLIILLVILYWHAVIRIAHRYVYFLLSFLAYSRWIDIGLVIKLSVTFWVLLLIILCKIHAHATSIST
jgi:hypothetical protein